MSTITFGNGTKRVRVSDFCWVRNRQLANRYTCPLLITLSMWVLRLRGERSYWWLNSPKDRVFCGYLTRRGCLCESRCLFPHSWIVAECNVWDWMLQKGMWKR